MEKLSNISAISKSKEIWGDFYDYSTFSYTKQHQFDNCKLLKKLKFDFYLPKKNTCIEYNGYQHYNSIRYFGGDAGYELRKKRDRIKEQFCIENKISLIVIKYDDDINDKLNFLYE